MKIPYFSVVVPCLNEEHFLPFLLKNLNSQSFTDFEVIVVDGNSDDKTAQVTKEFKSKYPLHLYSTTTRNVSFQRNLGAKKSKGNILIFFDADTQIPKDYLKGVAQAFEKKHPHFLSTYINVDSDKLSEKIYVPLSNFLFEFGRFFRTPLSYGAMQAVKKNVFFDIGGYDPQTKYGEDGQLFQKLYRANYKYIILKSPRYFFSLRRYRKDGIVSSLAKQFRLISTAFLYGYHASPKEEYPMGGKQYHSKTA